MAGAAYAELYAQSCGSRNAGAACRARRIARTRPPDSPFSDELRRPLQIHKINRLMIQRPFGSRGNLRQAVRSGHDKPHAPGIPRIYPHPDIPASCRYSM
jgi:hypothetical protein